MSADSGKSTTHTIRRSAASPIPVGRFAALARKERLQARSEVDHERGTQDQPSRAQRLTREQWLSKHVARAPKTTPEQWRKTRAILRQRDIAELE